MRRSHGTRQGTRSILRKSKRERRRIDIRRIMHEFKPGDRVAIVLDGAQQQGMPHRRFQGKVGTVVERQGRAYVVNFYDGNMAKTVIARPEHLRAMAMEE